MDYGKADQHYIEIISEDIPMETVLTEIARQSYRTSLRGQLRKKLKSKN